MTATTYRRAFVASAVALAATLSPIAAAQAGTAATDNQPTRLSAGGRVRVSSPDNFNAPDRFAWLALYASTDGHADVSVFGRPDGPDGEWRSIDIPVGWATANDLGPTAPESAEAFLRRILAAAAEVAGPDA